MQRISDWRRGKSVPQRSINESVALMKKVQATNPEIVLSSMYFTR
jgi:hypothetical protein